MAVQEAAADIESLRRYFVAHYGKPKETIVTGHSMGGFLTMMLMEMQPTVYDAGLPLCGPLAAPDWFMARGAFDSQSTTDQAGTQGLFVQQYVNHNGHCAITPDEIALGFSELRA